MYSGLKMCKIYLAMVCNPGEIKVFVVDREGNILGCLWIG